MNNFKTCFICFLALLALKSESQILSENFNTGVPVNWQLIPASTWSYSTFGISGSGCVISEDLTLNTPTNSIQTPALNLNGLTNFTITFKAAFVKNNFICPSISLHYASGTNKQFLARWGEGFVSPSTYTIVQSVDYIDPLDPENINWVSCTHTVAAINATNASFVFDAELINAGYALIDDVVITAKTNNTTGIEKNGENPSIVIFPNPSTDRKISLEGENIKNILVTDNTGKILKMDFAKTGPDSYEVNLAAFPNGIYYLTATKEDDTLIYRKIVVE